MRKHRLLALLLVIGAAPSMLARSCSISSNCNTICDTQDSCQPCKVVCPPCNACECKASAHTFLSIRPMYQIATPEHDTLFRNRLHAQEDGRHGAFQIVPFGSRTTNPGNLATFFTPFCKAVLLVAEDPSQNPDIVANFLNIKTVNSTFKSQISFAPKHIETGVGLSYKQGFNVNFCGCERMAWFELSMPINHVRNSLGFCENVIDDGGGVDTTTCPTITSDDPTTLTQPVANATQAFRQPQWLYGRITNNCSLSATRVSNFDILLGYEALTRDKCFLESYVGVTLPTGNRVKGVDLFEPIVGYNHHVGIMFGSNASLKLWCDDSDDNGLWLDFALNGIYSIRNCQKRLVDLKCKPWSRYMRVYKDRDQAVAAAGTSGADTNFCLATPGVDVFALDVRVHPGFQRMYNTGLVYNCDCFQAELGYNFWARSSECVELKAPWVEGPALLSPFPDSNGQAGQTDSVQVISDQFSGLNAVPVSQYNQNIIQQCDLDLNSAANLAATTHIVYGSVGWLLDTCYPMLIGIGGSYEISHDNAAIDRWAFWGKFGMSF